MKFKHWWQAPEYDDKKPMVFKSLADSPSVRVRITPCKGVAKCECKTRVYRPNRVDPLNLKDVCSCG